MMASRKRPLDAKNSLLKFTLGTTNDEDDGDNEADEETPFIKVDGINFFSDRFYLHRTSLDPPHPTSVSTNSKAFDAYNENCTCGARKSPPLLDRSKLVSSLQLKAAVLSTYSLDLGYMIEAFPTLCGPEATVPTLILHGLKGLSARMEGKAKSDDEYNDDDDGGSSCDEEYEHRRRHSGEDVDGNKQEELLINSSEHVLRSGNLGKMVHLTHVLSQWVPLDKQHAPKDGSWREVRPNLEKDRKAGRGVHHPKYMILFCVDGSVVVVVSTGNMTNPTATDASWLQRFETVDMDQVSNKFAKKAKAKRSNHIDSDFGPVLSNFLQLQSYAVRSGNMIPEEFLKQYMGYKSLVDFEEKFHFEKAQVYLIATVPGEYDSQEYGRFLYGRQKVSDIVTRSSKATEKHNVQIEGNRPWFPRYLLSDKDRLILQPTSIGTKIRKEDLSDIARCYLGLDDMVVSTTRSGHRRHGKHKSPEAIKATDVLKRVDIVWPAQKLIDKVTECYRGTRTKSPTAVNEIGTDPKDENIRKESTASATTSYLFLSSKAFNSIDVECLSQMVMFEPSIPEQRDPLPPHIKSIARLFEGNESKLRKECGARRAEEYFSWFLLTSACLSKGAQGERILQNSQRLSYKNFELGVIFCSRLQGIHASDRLYCWKPTQCCCSHGPSRNNENVKMIHLPLPYCCRPMRYQLDEDEVDFVETPYLHEIEPNTEAVGHMRFTPFGASIATAHNAGGTVKTLNML